MADQRIVHGEEAVALSHPTKTDVVNRIWSCVAVNSFRLIKSGANLTLEPVNGTLVDLNDVLHKYTTMPTLAPGALSANTTYYIYLYNNAGTPVLVASTTVPVIDTKGRAVMTGDVTRRLMGVARTIAGPAWVDSYQQRFVKSYDHRLPSCLVVALPSDRTTASASPVELSSADRLEFVSFADSSVQVAFVGRCDSTAISLINTRLYVDGVDSVGVEIQERTADDKILCAFAHNFVSTLPYRYLQIFGAISAGTATWRAGGTFSATVS